MKNVIALLLSCWVSINAFASVDSSSMNLQSQGAIEFVSLGMPVELLRQTMKQASVLNIPVVVRGVLNNDFKETARVLNEVIQPQQVDQPGIKAGISINPKLFREFGITKVPALVIVGKPSQCGSADCALDYDVVYGNIPLAQSLKIIAEKGDAGRAVAQNYLRKLGGNNAF